MKKDILRKIELICGIIKSDIEMNSTFDVADGLGYITEILNKTERTKLWEDIKKVVRYNFYRILKDIDENYPHWESINEIFKRVN